MTYNPFSLAGKTILVTGASSGIGRATAIECSKMGAKVCVTGRNEYRLIETLMFLDGEGHSSHIADLTDEKQVEELVGNLPKLDGIVHSAGVIPEEGTLSVYIETDDMIDLFRSNVLHIINLNSMLMQLGKLKSGTSIVHISSYSANNPSLGLGMYCITKSALATYSKTLATELAYKKMRVNTLLPGMVDTKTVIDITQDNPNFVSDRESYPFNYGKPEDVAWACLYLLSDAARWITGSEIILDGGSLLKWR